MLQNDPPSAEAVALLVRAGRADDAVDVVERIVRTRPDQFRRAMRELEAVIGLHPTPQSLARAGRIDALRKLAAQSSTSEIDSQPAQTPAESAADQGKAAGASNVCREGRAASILSRARQEISFAEQEMFELRVPTARAFRKAAAVGQRRLRDVASSDRMRCGLEALADLARSEFRTGQLRSALRHFLALERRYPDSEVAWLAAMRSAQLTQTLSGSTAAAAMFGRVRTAYSAKPSVIALAAYYEARAFEAAQRWGDALRMYRTSRDAWPVADREWGGLEWSQWTTRDRALGAQWPDSISRDDVVKRIDALDAAASVPWGARIERALWLLERHRPQEALMVVDNAMARYSADSGLDELRLVKHRAELARAIGLVGRSGEPGRSSRRMVVDLCGPQFDVWVGIACSLRASFAAMEGRSEEARVELDEVLTRWSLVQSRGAMPDELRSPIEQDALALHDLLFRPEVYSAQEAPRFFLMPSELRVTTSETEDPRRVPSRAPRGMSNVVLLSLDQARVLSGALEALGICPPEGGNAPLIDLWIGATGTLPRSCSGILSILSLPTVGPIAFAGEGGTRAVVPVSKRTDSQVGSHLLVEKADDGWRIVGVVGGWVY